MRSGDASPQTAHPRSRGENVSPACCARGEGGSSPLTRGKLPRPRGRSSGCRLIPAHAGKTTAVGPAPCRARAHPRSRGENGCILWGRHLPLGSSPLTRGKLPRPRGRSSGCRLIPAHAGKTCGRTGFAPSSTAHPRSRGENHHAGYAIDAEAGSSPLTRGKQDLGYRCDGLIGLIPAHAGKTVQGRRRCRHGRAHPRSRGENWSCRRR